MYQRYSRNSDGVTPCGGAKQRWGMIKPAIFQKHGASINRSIQRAINLVRRSTAINTLATAVRVSTVNSHFQSNEHWKVEYEHPFSRASAAQQLKACPCLSYPNSVRPSVCLSHAGIVSKLLNWFFHHTIAHSFQFLPLTHVLLAPAFLFTFCESAHGGLQAAILLYKLSYKGLRQALREHPYVIHETGIF